MQIPPLRYGTTNKKKQRQKQEQIADPYGMTRDVRVKDKEEDSDDRRNAGQGYG
jgi:hypothetical protein